MIIVNPEVDYQRDPGAVRRILEALPDWFADPAAIENYVSDAGDDLFVCALSRTASSVTGVALVRRHFRESAELHLIAVDPDFRGRGIGRALVDRVAADLVEDGCIMMSVHTVGPSFESDPYAQTRSFYRSVGFVPLEEHDNLDWPGPTLIFVRPLIPG